MPGMPILPPLAALTLHAAWVLVLVLAIGAWRAGEVMAGQKKVNEFPSGTQHGGDTYWRLNRAHMNTVENLPVFAALVLAGAYLQVQDLAFQVLPSVVLYARIVQTIIHITSGSALAVSLRFVAYVVQVASMFVLAGCVLTATGVGLPW
jgi:uncharacterized MAPEG superfamily protein